MTKFERLSLFGVSLSLLISIGAPFATYFWLDTSTKAYRERGRFVVVKYEMDSRPVAKGLPSFHVVVRNVGGRPSEGVQIGAVFPNRSKENSKSVFFDPPAVATELSKDNLVFDTLTRTIGPNEELTIRVDRPLEALYLYTKEGDSLLIYQNTIESIPASEDN